MGKKYAYLLWIVPLLARITHGIPIEIEEPDVASEAEEIGGHFEGDIVLDSTQEEIIATGRTALIGPSYRWPNYVVFYAIEAGHFTTSQQTAIQTALEEIMAVSCVKFVPRTTQTDYVRVTGEYTGCWSYLGHIGGAQQLNLQPNGCMSKGTIMHEFLHSLGFVHMQSASDRDFFVKINWGAIIGGKSSNFNRYDSTVINDFGIPYDYYSVMHYRANAFTVNGDDTIIPIESGVTIGQRVGLSYKDIKRLNHLYPNCA
ncbi:AAEL011543-PA [Aedes aegypti]|uniref:Metalloendopeptidase n=2 Tax=Aedes aegypti TaxID=7159 RepID=A0A1S4FTV9_AEDAE|nr:astacin [Aedes aegypti]EAT36357.1 AAEL011543-PA [Aedes aegypti]